MRIAVLNGPNLNLLGVREPERYGTTSLETIRRRLLARGKRLGVRIEPWIQSNDEGALVDAAQGLLGRSDGALVNAAAFTHTSVALRDALLAAGVPFVEVHLSNVWAREPFRRHSLLADIAVGVVAGFGPESYLLGLEALAGHLRAGGPRRRSPPAGRARSSRRG